MLAARSLGSGGYGEQSYNEFVQIVALQADVVDRIHGPRDGKK